MTMALKLVLLLIVHLYVFSLSTSQECRSLVTCSDCIIKNSSCGWCNDENVFTQLVSDINTQLQPASLCRLPQELVALGCKDIVNPQGNQTQQQVRDYDDSPAVTPQQVHLSLRPGISQNFNITINPPSSISVDMYILMDLSFTMRDDLQNLRQFADQLVEQMQNLTDEFRIGFGSFIDKPVSPFIDRNVNFSCAADYPEVTEADCEGTYAFRHRLDLTDNVGLFKTELSNAKISGSVDQAEATLDAMLQVAVCQDAIGWRDVGEARRLILVLTDGDYHIALDGKLAGLRDVPSKECRLNPITKQYDYASKVDYPSSTFLADILNEQRMIPIFAVEKNVRSVYDQLGNIIKSAFVGELTSNSDNLLELISSQYVRLSTTVVPVVNGLENLPELSISLTPLNNCSNGILLEGNTCTGITHPDSVTYNVSVSISSSYCTREAKDGGHQLGILFIGFGDVLVNVSVICNCDCSEERVLKSSKCNNVGIYECSTCVCPTNSFNGPQCQCPVRSVTRSAGCRHAGSNDTVAVCSNRGTCECNECICGRENGRVYQGQHCECDPNACPSGLDESGRVRPCSGHGTCGCDTRCICDAGYSGISCDCPSTVNSCVNPSAYADYSGLLCTGAGQCTCGTCVCDDYSVRSGTYCEECGICVRSCSTLSNCVSCYIEGNCGPSCSHVNVTSLAQYNTTGVTLRTCPVPHDSCEINFQVGIYVVGNEDSITVLLDMSQSGIAKWRDGCSNQLQIWLIPVGIVIGIIVLVIIVLVLWKGISFLLEYLEFKAWKESQENELWNTSGENPLFVDPTTSHINPKYRSRPVNVQTPSQ